MTMIELLSLVVGVVVVVAAAVVIVLLLLLLLLILLLLVVVVVVVVVSLLLLQLGQLSPDAKVFVAKSVIIYLLQETINDWYIQGQSRRDDCQPTVSTIHIIISVIIFLWF